MPFILAELGPFHVARPTANLTIETAVQDRKDLEAFVKVEGHFDLVLDLSRTERVDGAGMGAVVSAATTARNKGRQLIIYRPTQNVQTTMEKLELSGFFPQISSEADFLSRLPD